jgi:hypothetical protein
LALIEGMGHDLPRELWQELATRIAHHVRVVEASED